jgi:DNA-binding FadR family transcriptional regulator
MGIIQIRSGAGAFVTQPALSRETLSDKLRWLLDRREMVLKMLDIREVLQVLAARLCAGRTTEAEATALEETVREMRAAFERGDLDSATDADARFHFLVGELCGNEILNDLIRHVEETYHSSSRALMDLRGRTPTSIQEHGAVLAAILERDPTAAEAAMRVHLSSVRRALSGLPSPESAREGTDGQPT